MPGLSLDQPVAAERRPPQFRRRTRIIALVALTAASCSYACIRLLAGFSFYDDEGALMLMTRWMLDGHPAYGQFRSIYGPFYFFYKFVIHGLAGGVVTNTAVRLMAAIPWTLASMMAFGYTLRTTGSRIASLCAWLLTLRGLSFFVAEPGHPQEICILLVIAILWLTALRRMRWGLAGALVAALLLSKVNLGIYAGAGLLAAAASATGGRPARYLLAVVMGFCAVAPFLVMQPILGDRWAREEALLISTSIFLLGGAIWMQSPNRLLRGREWVRMAAGFAIAICGVLAWMIGRGGSLGVMLDSTVLDNIAQAHTWTLPLASHIPVLATTAAGVAAALLCRRWRAVAWLKLATGGSVLVLIFAKCYAEAFAIAMPFLWLVVVSPYDTQIRRLQRIALAAITAVHGLVIYPVASSQLRFSLVLIGLSAVVCTHDAVMVLTPRWLWQRKTALAAAGILIALYAGWLVSATYKYASFSPLDLPGTAGIRLDPADRAVYQSVVRSVMRNCETVVSFPAVHSLYFWTGKFPPVYEDVDGWQPYLNPQRQATERSMLERPRSCVVYNDELVPFWLPAAGRDGKTLNGYIRERFVERERMQRFHILVPNNTARP